MNEECVMSNHNFERWENQASNKNVITVTLFTVKSTDDISFSCYITLSVLLKDEQSWLCRCGMRPRLIFFLSQEQKTDTYQTP